MVMQREATCLETAGSTRSAGGVLLPAISPDGAATAEVYTAPDSVFAEDPGAANGEAAAMNDEPQIASRMPLVVRALAVAGLDDAGRVRVGGRPAPIWVIGRAGGASDYSASLGSAVRAAVDIASVLGEQEAGT